MSRCSGIRVVIVFLVAATACESLSANGIAEAKTDANDIAAAQTHLERAGLYYWLSRVRNGSRVEMLQCKKECEAASRILWGLPDSPDKSELLNQVRTQRNQAVAQLAYARWFLENYSPVLRFLAKKDDVLVRYDLSGLVSVAHSLEHLLSEHPLLWRGTLYVLVSSEPQDGVVDSSLVDEAVHSYLNTHTQHYVIPRHELRGYLDDAEIEAAYGEAPSNEVLDKVCSVYGSEAIEGIGIIRVGQLDRVGNLTRTEARFRHWDRAQQTWGLSHYAMGFSERRRRLPIVAFALPLLGVPMACLYQRRARHVSGSACPIWVPLAASAIAIILLILANIGIGKFGPDLNQLCYAPSGLLWIVAISTLYSVLPLIAAYAVSALAPSVGRALNRPDTTASIVAGSLLGGVAVLTNLAWVRMGNSVYDVAQILAMAGCGILVAGAGGYQAGYAWFKWTAIRERISALAIVVLVLLGILFYACFLTGDLPTVLLVTSVCLVVIVGLRPLVKVGVRTNTDFDGHDNPRARPIEDQVLTPDFVLPEAVKQGFANAVHFLTEVGDTNIVRVVYIEGREGCGKTRLAWEIAERVQSLEKEHSTRCVILYGDSDNPNGASTVMAYAPFVHALGGVLGVNRLADPEQSLHKLRGMVGQAGLKGLGAFGLGILGTVLDVAGLGGEQPRATSEGEIAYVIAQTLSSLSQGELTEKGRVLFIFDDGHWCGSESVRLLGRVFEALHQLRAGGRVDFIIACRPGSVIGKSLRVKAAQGTVGLHIDNESLELAEKRGEFVGALLEGLRFDLRARVALSAKCHECGCGRPLHILSMLQMVVSKGWAREVDGRYAISADADLSQVRVSNEFWEMLEEEFKNLDSKLCDILQCCAAIGTEFRASAIAYIFQIDVFETLRLLGDAEKRSIIQDVRDQDDVFQFREKRVAWYFRQLGVVGDQSNVPCQRVREYHKRYVQFIEAGLSQRGVSGTEASQEELKALAHHTRMLRDVWPERTIKYNRLAGERSYKQGMFAKAMSLFEVVDSTLVESGYVGTDSDRFSFYLTFARCLLDAEVASGRPGRCIERLGGMVADQIPHELVEEFWTLEVLYLYRIRKYPEAHEKALQVLNSERLADKHRLRLQFYVAASAPRSDEGTLRRSIEAHCDVLQAVDRYLMQEDNNVTSLGEMEALKGEILNNLGFRYLCVPGSEGEAEEYFKKALEIKEKPEHNDLKGIAMVHGGLGDCFLERKRLNLAKQEYEKDYSISTKIGDQGGICRMSSMLGRIALLEASETTDERSRLNLLNDAQRCYEESLCVARSQSDVASILFAMAGLLGVAVESGEERRAERECDRVHDTVCILSIKDDSGLEYARNTLTRSIEQVRDKFPVLADKLGSCVALLSR